MIRKALSLVLATWVVQCCFLSAYVRADDEDDLIAAFKQADKLFDAEKYDPVQYAKAIPFYEKALRLAPRVYGENHQKTADIRNDFGQLLRNLKRYPEAETQLQRSLKIRETVLGKNHIDVAQSVNNLADLYAEQSKYTEAEPLYQRGLQILEKVRGKDHIDVTHVLNNLAILYTDQAKYAEAEPLYQRSLKIREAALGKNHPDVAQSLNNLGILYRDQAKYSEAEPLYLRSLRIRETALGRDHLDVAQSLSNLATLYRDQSQFDKAEPLYKRCLKIRESKLGPDHIDVAQTLNNLADMYSDQSKYTEAEPLYRRCLKIVEAVHDKDHPEVAVVLNALAILNRNQAKYTEAESLYQRSLKIRETAFGKDHVDVAQSLNNLAGLYHDQAKFAEAEPLYQRSLKIRETKLGNDHIDVAQTLNNLANLYSDQAKFSEAETLFKRSLKIREAVRGKESIDVADTLNDIANLYRSQAKFVESELFYQRSLKIREAKFGKNHVDVAQSLNNLANLYGDQAKYADAEPLLQRSLKIREAIHGNDHPAIATSLNDLANLYRNQSKNAEAEPLYQRSLKIREAVLGKDHIDVGHSLNNLANLYCDQLKYAEAEPLYQRSLKIRETVLGKNHPDVAQSLNNLAILYQELEKYTDAEPLYQRSIEIYRARLGKDHPDTSTTVSSLAYLYARQARYSDAIRTNERALRSLHRHTITVLPVLSEKEQLEYLELKLGIALRTGFSLALTGKVQEENRMRMASWLLNSKGLALESLSERLLLARNNASKESNATLAELEAVRRQLAQLTLGGKGSTAKQIEELREKEKRLESSLQGFDTRTQRDDPWFEIDELRQKLPAKAVLIDITRFAVTNFKVKLADDKRPDHYVAFLTTSTGDVEVVDLGLAETIDAAVTKARNDLAASPKQIKAIGEPAAEKALRQSLDALAKLILQPLLPHITKSEQWIISPDSNLWLVPWAALPLDAKSYVVEKHRIHYVVSGRDLILNPLKLDRKSTAPIVIADPDFDLTTSGTKQPDGTRGVSDGLNLGRINRLPGTALEAEAVIPKLKALAGVAPQLFTDNEAVAGAIRGAKGPRVVIFATHGFFLPDQEKKVESPLLRCGLLLAGCNQAAKAKPGEETGVLTGLEIVNTDLRGTEMVVLSACETGLGEVQNGNGVAGLRQAFQLAGAESVVATLWQIPDVQSAQLMVGFFDNLNKKQLRAEALRESQLDLIQSRRDRFGAAHPYFWAAYTVTGQVK